MGVRSSDYMNSRRGNARQNAQCSVDSNNGQLTAETNLAAITTLLEKIAPRVSGRDRDWEIYLKPDSRWIKFQAKLYDNTWYFSILEEPSRRIARTLQLSFSYGLKTEGQDLDASILEIQDRLPAIRRALAQTIERIERDPLTYHGELLRSLPPTLRYGVLPRSFVRDLLPEWQTFHKELTASEVTRMIALCERSDAAPLHAMTSGRFFEYCRVAYGANPTSFDWHSQPLDTEASGVDLYSRYADGRDDGLRKLDPNSPDAFLEWYCSSRFGGHPWEIYRGGNSTHIDLAVVRETIENETVWRILLSAFSSTRLVETCRIALALEAAGLPFVLDHKDSYLRRLRGTDMVGLVPEEVDLRYGYHEFPNEFKVADSIRFEWFRDERTGRQIRPWREIAAAATWLPIPELRVSVPQR